MSQSHWTGTVAEVPALFMCIEAQAKPVSYRVQYSGSVLQIKSRICGTCVSRISQGAIQRGPIRRVRERISKFRFKSQYCTLVPHASGLMARSILPVTIHFHQACTTLYPTPGSIPGQTTRRPMKEYISSRIYLSHISFTCPPR